MEAAEFSKLVENTFRAVNIAWINEMADAAKALGLDIAEVIDAAATKPFGYTKFTPGAGVGGHCIPCDPHYLLGVLPAESAPITAMSMHAIHARPNQVSESALANLTAKGIALTEVNVVIAGIAYKPDVQDMRESPALGIMSSLLAAGVNVSFYDPLVDSVTISGNILTSIDQSEIGNAHLVIWHTAHQSMAPHRVLADAVSILDTTYRLDLLDSRVFRI